uniref:Uncharacterized protein n=1 Tax=Acrobeloides nanus TaxID=290746 RepID=A0A914ENK3_9BILA
MTTEDENENLEEFGKRLHAPDVSWNKPFKDSILDQYKTWMMHELLRQARAEEQLAELIEEIGLAEENMDDFNSYISVV